MSRAAAPPLLTPGPSSTMPLNLCVERRGASSWVLSIGLHVLLTLALALIVRAPVSGTPNSQTRAGGIVLAFESQGDPEYFSEATADGDLAANSPVTTADSDALPSPQSPGSIEAEFAGALPDLGSSSVGDVLANALPGADRFTEGQQPGKQLGQNQVETSIFGVTGVGSKFVYVFDRSRSMSGYGGRPLRAAKTQLIASLDVLQATNQFQIVFYNEKPSVFNPRAPLPAAMMFGTEDNVAAATQFVQGISGRGGTRHMDALRVALRLAPDVVFFLTDADYPQMTSTELNEVRRLNRTGVCINVIEFGAGGFRGQSHLQILARANSGQHAYVDVTRLGGD